MKHVFLFFLFLVPSNIYQNCNMSTKPLFLLAVKRVDTVYYSLHVPVRLIAPGGQLAADELGFFSFRQVLLATNPTDLQLHHLNLSRYTIYLTPAHPRIEFTSFPLRLPRVVSSLDKYLVYCESFQFDTVDASLSSTLALVYEGSDLAFDDFDLIAPTERHFDDFMPEFTR
jgi:hypothetical protein